VPTQPTLGLYILRYINNKPISLV